MVSVDTEQPAGRPARILPLIIFSQFAGTSLWFAGNAIIPDLTASLHLGERAAADVTSAVQFGFIAGTLLLAITRLTDRISPRIVFLVSSLTGAVCNALLLFDASYPVVITLRFLTGIALAGIYPVGMKIAAGWYREGLGSALGYLVGALVLGTSLPHLLRSVAVVFGWREVISTVSLLAASGGLLVAMFVQDGPHLSAPTTLTRSTFRAVFAERPLRRVMFGYFGHMWELYTFYAFVPLMISRYTDLHPGISLDLPFWSFAIIGAGGTGCIIGGVVSQKIGSARVAAVQLAASGALCLCSPFLFLLSSELFLAALILWGVVVVGDSPQFSTLVTRFAPAGLVGSSLTLSVSIGFAITIVSIQATAILSTLLPANFLLVPLSIGPLIGLLYFRSVASAESNRNRTLP